ncbi:hypothetical protein [Acinetobacter sp.]|uniref:hypothetical protein n=1 Tax=Acinetobacter sp. TaxID=472 RepID=UPI003890F834
MSENKIPTEEVKIVEQHVEIPEGAACGAIAVSQLAVSQLAHAFANAKHITTKSPPLKPATFTVAPVKPAPAPAILVPPKPDRRDAGKTLRDRLEFDRFVVQYYTNKLTSCKARGIAFNLTFLQVKNLLRAKKCQYTGILLTHTNGPNGQRDTDLTIERIDNNRPYETGNVCAVSFAANQAKSAFDAKFGKDAVTMIHKMSKALKKRGIK